MNETAKKQGQTLTEKPRSGGKRATPPGHVKVFKTAVFKIHSPSKRKKAMMWDAMKRAHLAYGKLLYAYMPDEKEVERLSKLSKRDRREELKPLHAKVIKASRFPQLSNNAKDAIRVDALAQISSTIGLQDEQEEVGYPTVSRINRTTAEYENALDGIMATTALDDETKLRHELLTLARMGQVRPLAFVRTGISGGFHLLRHPDTNRLYAWLNLHPKGSRFASQVRVQELASLKTGEIVSFRSSTGALFPLEMGHAFHDDKFIQEAEPQTARLYHRTERNGIPCDDYELHVTFQYIVPRKETSLWMGVDRGIYNLAAYSVVTESGLVVDSGSFSGMELRHVQRQLERRAAKQQKRGKIVRDRKRQAHADEAVHVTSNALVEVAANHDAQLVLEDLRNLSGVRRTKRKPGTRRGGFNRLLNRVQYEKLKKVLKYKLKQQGLPEAVFVRAAGTSQTCPGCGHWSRENRKKTAIADGFQMDTFACVKCGFTADADENAARVIAMKGCWLTGLPKKSERKPGPLPDSLKFEIFLQDCAERRMGA